MPWIVTFTPRYGRWEYHAFVRWDDAVLFAFDIVYGDCERRDFWLRQLA